MSYINRFSVKATKDSNTEYNFSAFTVPIFPSGPAMFRKWNRGKKVKT